MGALKGKTTLITGAGSGIGRAIARRFHEEGAFVVICGRREQALSETVRALSPDGERTLAVPADVTRAEDVKRVVSAAVERTGALHVLVNNAGIMRFAKLEESTPALWEEMLKVNTIAPWMMMAEAIPVMRRQSGGSIINLSSIAGNKALVGSGIYCTTKAALQMMSQVFALEAAPDKIRVNLICPGLVEETELADPIYKTAAKVGEFYARLRPLHPLGRSGRPTDIAEAALFLASDASAWISGILLPVDGGRHLATNRPPI